MPNCPAPQILWLAFVAAGVFPLNAADAILLTDVTAQTGITFKHTDGGSGRRYVVETVTAGLALFDYDRDGDVDIYFLNGAPLPGTPSNPPPRNALYRNDGNWKFTDVTAAAGVGDTGFGLGVAIGDYDNDGHPDIYLNNYGPNVLYHNNGNGTFTDVTARAGVDCGHEVGAGACFLDMDADGDLDLYVANYLVFSVHSHQPATMKGIPIYTGPPSYPPVADQLFRNNGDGTFTDVSQASGIAAYAGTGMGMVCADYDNDGDTDIFVANDVAANFLFQNDGQGHFTERGLLSGFAYDFNGEEHGSMGVTCGDYNNDGLLDFYVTSFQGQFATLYQNLGNRMFEDVTMLTGAGVETVPKVTWGSGFVDFDNDGDRDLFVACGHLQDNIERYDDTSTYFQPNLLYVNDGQGKFACVSPPAGSGLAVKLSSRGAGFDDLDNDGDVDVVILNSRREPTVLRNDTPAKGNWLQVSLHGSPQSNRDGVGAQVRIQAGSLKLLDEVHSGRAYQSHFGSRLYFGLGGRDRVDQIEVRWIGGGANLISNVPVNQHLTIKESGR